MDTAKKRYVWAKQEIDENCPLIDAPAFDPYKDFHRDRSGIYALIRVDFATLTIDVAICDKDHKIIAVFRGTTPQAICEAIFRHEKQNGVEWFTDKSHIAYLGKELKKAQIALAMGSNAYFQE